MFVPQAPTAEPTPEPTPVSSAIFDICCFHVQRVHNIGFCNMLDGTCVVTGGYLLLWIPINLNQHLNSHID
jgi:hypothetical protein